MRTWKRMALAVALLCALVTLPAVARADETSALQGRGAVSLVSAGSKGKSKKADSLKTRNTIAHIAYQKILQNAAYVPVHPEECCYRFVDAVGDDVDELLLHVKENQGSSSTLHLFSYDGKKTRHLLEWNCYGIQEIRFYKKTSAFVASKRGHGGEGQYCFELTGSVFKQTAFMGRAMGKGSGGAYGEWNCLDGDNQPITKQEADAIFERCMTSDYLSVSAPGSSDWRKVTS